MTSHRDHAAYELAYVVGKRLADQMIAAVCDEYADDLIEEIKVRRQRMPHPDLDDLSGAQVIRLIRETKTEGH